MILWLGVFLFRKMDSLWLTQNAAYFEGKKGQAPNPNPCKPNNHQKSWKLKKKTTKHNGNYIKSYERLSKPLLTRDTIQHFEISPSFSTFGFNSSSEKPRVLSSATRVPWHRKRPVDPSTSFEHQGLSGFDSNSRKKTPSSNHISTNTISGCGPPIFPKQMIFLSHKKRYPPGPWN